jgi:hypothetical protein
MNFIFEQSFLKTLDCGLIKASFLDVLRWNKHVGLFVIRFIETLPEPSYTIDIKVHMLMPGQFPCIPGWHLDLVPRGSDGKQMMDRIDASQKMYLLVSGPPITEFRDGRKIVPGEFTEFTQLDEHRGTVSTEHCWRMFIRIAPSSIYPKNEPEMTSRRHCQVYLDAETFKW